jgi:hypothetical protein
MRCPDCQKFTSLELQDPEVSGLTVEYQEPEDNQSEPTFYITGTVRIVRNCGECGQEMKEANFELEQTLELGENVQFTITDKLRADPSPFENVTVEEDGVEAIEEGGGRYQKSYFGATVHLTVYLDAIAIASGDWSDKVPASAMDELV